MVRGGLWGVSLVRGGFWGVSLVRGGFWGVSLVRGGFCRGAFKRPSRLQHWTKEGLT